MKITVTDTSINIDMDPDAKGTHWSIIDHIMDQISAQIGDKWGAVKLSGYWVISQVRPEDGDTKWRPVFGGHEQPTARKFTKALATATQRAVVTVVPFK